MKILFSNIFRLCPQEWLNPHRGIFGRGNYNINIIMKALQLRDHEAVWFDKRRFFSHF